MMERADVGRVENMAADYNETSPETPIEDRLDAIREEEAAREQAGAPSSLPTEADPADVVEQHIEVPIDEDDEAR